MHAIMARRETGKTLYAISCKNRALLAQEKKLLVLKVERQLNEVGISTINQLLETGSKKAWLKIRSCQRRIKGVVKYGIGYYSYNRCTCRYNPWDNEETQDFGNSISNCTDYHCNNNVIFLHEPLLKFR
ncbi:hypothetical protein A7K50_13375 [Dehalobacter sp. MCB1]|nr:hypothetical protein A7K50_13375 [Dehalobacter sp. MCB1]